MQGKFCYEIAVWQLIRSISALFVGYCHFTMSNNFLLGVESAIARVAAQKQNIVKCFGR